MRTTLDISAVLMQEALELTHIRTKTELIRVALENLIQREKIKGMKNYFGTLELDIDLETLRKR